MSSKPVGLLILLSFLLYFFIQLIAIKNESLTWDETAHYNIGYQALFNNFTVDPLSGTFTSQIAVIPQLFNQRYNPRLTIIVYSLLTAVAIFAFCKRYFDQKVGIFALLFFLFEPTVFANSHYLTLDIGFSLLFFLCFWLSLNFLKNFNFKNAIITGFAIGLLFATKVTGIFFYTVSIIPLLFINKIFINKKYFFVFILSIVIGIWFTYRFSFGTLGGYVIGGTRKSNQIVVEYPFLEDVFIKTLSAKLPLGDYLRILKNSYIYNLSPKYSFFLGETRDNPGRLFIPLLFFKLPISLIIFFSFGLLGYRKKLTLILVPIVSILIYIFFSNVNLRLRYILPVFPFIAIVAAYGFTKILGKKNYFKIPVILLYLLFFVNFAKSFPHTVAFANEISGFFGKPYLVLSDSNIDWGQGLIALKDYVIKNKIGRVDLSYYGTDNPKDYGFIGFTRENMCKKSCTIETTYPNYKYKDNTITALSITNWQECGFYKSEKYQESKIKDLVGGSILIFK